MMDSSDSGASAKGASSGDEKHISPSKSTGKRVIASDDDSSDDAPVSCAYVIWVFDNNLCRMPTRRWHRRLVNKQAMMTTDMIVLLLRTILLVS
jgi:hypothetical protein